MADFNVSLSGPQAAGAGTVAPVQERVIPRDTTLIESVVDIFAKGLQGQRKEDAEARKNAVIKEYVNNEKTFSDALISGQWNANKVAMHSRANFNKFLASNSEYASELMEARKAVYEGTETGEAQKQIARETELREGVKRDATKQGYVFYPGMSKAAEDATIDTYNYTIRASEEMERQAKANTEARAQGSYEMSVDNHLQKAEEARQKKEAVSGLVTIADKNFGLLSNTVTDLMARTDMNYEQKLVLHSGNVQRIKQGLLAISASNPELAAPWQKLVDDIDMVSKAMLDPKIKTESEAAMLKAQYDSILYRSKISAVSDPKLLKYVVATDLFKDPALIQASASPTIIGYLSEAGSGQPNTTPIIGTENEKATLDTFKKALNNLNNGKVDNKEKASLEAVNTANKLMRETTKVDGGISPTAFKHLSTFYGSSEFGILASSGKLDKETMQNAKKVAQVAYEPAVRAAVIERLNSRVADGETLLSSVNIRMSGSEVVFENKKTATPAGGVGIDGFVARGMRGNEIVAGQAAIKEASAGLNTLIRMGAHLEGTTDYGKYWEENRHHLLPNVFPDPAKLKEGQVVDGYKYLGGAYSDRNNWQRQETTK